METTILNENINLSTDNTSVKPKSLYSNNLNYITNTKSK